MALHTRQLKAWAGLEVHKTVADQTDFHVFVNHLNHLTSVNHLNHPVKTQLHCQLEQQRHPLGRAPSNVNMEAALASEIFDHFCSAQTFKSILRAFR